jgi:two-component system, sensor histidine kinase
VNTKTVNKTNLPWWTWIAPLALFQIGFWASSFFKTPNGSSLFYLPIAFGIILVHWWGPRVVLAMFVSSLLNMLWMNIEPSLVALALATHGPVCIYLSWFLFRLKYKSGSQITDISHLYWFIVFGIFIPVSINALYELAITWNEMDPLRPVLLVLMPDFVTNFAFTLPVLLYTTPLMSRAGWTIYKDNSNFSVLKLAKHVNLIELLVIMIALLVLSFVVPFERYWYIYGVMALYIAIRFGFEGALAANLFIFMITYILPITLGLHLEMYNESNLLNVHLGMCMLYISATVMGRVMSDVRGAREDLQRRNEELEITNKMLKHTNEELDRFVYSVSHDLSAPLKSVKGLISLSRYEPDSSLRGYLDKIHSSVSRLEKFIIDILDYSRNNRQELRPEKLDISMLVKEVLENLSYVENFQKIKIDTDGLKCNSIVTDPTRLRIILNNIIGNAVKYHKTNGSIVPFISISSQIDNNAMYIEVKDNGEGMSQDVQSRVFEMFYRGSTKSEGSGLGLYIAKESAAKIKGKLTVESREDKGSTFVLTLPIN